MRSQTRRWRAPGLPPENVEERIVVAESGERVYFTSGGQLTPDAPAGRGLYVWRSSDPHSISFVAPSDLLSGSGASVDAVTTPDGAVLLFRAGRTELDELTGAENGGVRQYYRYDDRTRRLTCVSCPLGAATREVNPLDQSNFLGPRAPRVLSEDGDTFVFRTRDPLVVQDENRGEDINSGWDIYEWHDGEVGLITDGQHSGPHLPGSPTVSTR